MGFTRMMLCEKKKEIKQYGEYRTRRFVLEKWDGIFGTRRESR
jgi:hypothetical protein